MMMILHFGVTMGDHRINTLAELALCAVPGDVAGRLSPAIRYPACASAMRRYRALENQLDNVDLTAYNKYCEAYHALVTAQLAIDTCNLLPIAEPAAAWQLPLNVIMATFQNALTSTHFSNVIHAIERLRQFDVNEITRGFEEIIDIQASMVSLEENMYVMLTYDDIQFFSRAAQDDALAGIGKRLHMESIMLLDYDRLQRTSTPSSWYTTCMFLIEELRKTPYLFIISDDEALDLGYKLKFSEFARSPRFRNACAESIAHEVKHDWTVVQALVHLVSVSDPFALVKMYFSS